MILVAGVPQERPTAMVIEALDAISASFRIFDQRRFREADISVEIGDAAAGGTVGGTLWLNGETLRLESVEAIYLRLMDDNLLPQVAEMSPATPERRHCRRFHELLMDFAAIVPARVLNRPADMASNRSKPFQAHAIREVGFDIPETLITNHIPSASDFIQSAWIAGYDVVYKSMSGIRSIVQTVKKEDLARLEHIRWCPTQFQRRVLGTDIRVHVVGDTALASEIDSVATDYRYANRQTGTEPSFRPIRLDVSTRARCVRLAQRLRLPLAGIDLRRTVGGRHVCFEVNPSPAFSFYEDRTGLPIAETIARYLAGET